MRYATVCSGIEACSVAWEPLGWEPQWFSEIEAFPSAVLAHHYPNTPNLGDMEKLLEQDLADIDVLCGGTPCQSFSVAGLRGGMDDPRGNLAAVFCALAGKLRPRWVVWENVPGVLSSNGGRDFGSILGALAELGYGLAYRVLDAQYFGLAQRRKRVFVVGYLGDWRRAAAVLFEPEGLRGDSAPSRGEGKAAPTIPSRSTAGGGLGTDFDCDGGLIARAFGGNNQSGAIDVATACTAKGGSGRMDFETETFIAHALRGEGFDASEDGSGLGTPLVPVEEPYTLAIRGRGDSHDLEARQDGLANALLTPNGGRGGIGVGAVAFHNRQDPDVSGDVTHPLGAKDNGLAVAFSCKDHGADAGELAPTAEAGRTGKGDSAQRVASAMSVRRLTPLECSRLQGFPDEYLDITYRNKPAADGPKYKALGNSMAVPVMHWIGRRIDLMDAMA